MINFRTVIDQNVMMNSAGDIVKDLQEKVASATDNMILSQLNDFVSRGLIEVEIMQPLLMRESDSSQITLQQSLRLVLKDKEYIEKLEQENADLKMRLADIANALDKDLE